MEWCRLQSQWKICDFCNIITTRHVDGLRVDSKPLVWRCLAIVLVETDWFEAFGVDVEAEFLSECWETIGVAWSSVSFLESSCLLPSINDLPGIIPYICIVAEVSRRGILQALIITSGVVEVVVAVVAVGCLSCSCLSSELVLLEVGSGWLIVLGTSFSSSVPSTSCLARTYMPLTSRKRWHPIFLIEL